MAGRKSQVTGRDAQVLVSGESLEVLDAYRETKSRKQALSELILVAAKAIAGVPVPSHSSGEIQGLVLVPVAVYDEPLDPVDSGCVVRARISLRLTSPARRSWLQVAAGTEMSVASVWGNDRFGAVQLEVDGQPWVLFLAADPATVLEVVEGPSGANMPLEDPNEL